MKIVFLLKEEDLRVGKKEDGYQVVEYDDEGNA
jgi:hypothetical protein